MADNGWLTAAVSVATAPSLASLFVWRTTIWPTVSRANHHSTMKLYTYLNYGGNCRQAFEFYAEHLGGRITQLSTFADAPPGMPTPPDWKDAILHARLELGETVVMGADVPPGRFQPMRSAYLSLLLDSTEQAERTYALLAEGGEIFMKMEENFFAHRFAMLRDRFGTSWMLLHERAAF